jgi:hypothetical protein
MKLLGIINVEFDVTDQLLIRFSSLVMIRKRMGVQCYSTSAIHRIHESVGFNEKGRIFNILIEFGTVVKIIYLRFSRR